tara:strand:+ start:9 stop:3821 length:3813 start_codon:yes stop_codon:yes gene_type:complete
MFSWGTQQSIKMLFIVGEQGYADMNPTDGILVPSLSGVYLGNNALDAIYEQSFAFYWKRNNSLQEDRIRAGNFHYGSRAQRQSGDPETNDDIFLCPTANGDNDDGFSATQSPSNNREFGCFAPIANGTIYLLNWRIIPILNVKGDDDPGNQNAYERIKIAGVLKEDGTEAKVDEPHFHGKGMAGTGRAYSRRMGVVKLKSGTTEYTASSSERLRVLNANKDDEIVFKITAGGAANKIPVDFYNNGKNKVDDINSTVDSMNEAADDQLQVGEIFQIGLTYWQVTHRSLQRWNAEKEEQQLITLKCIDDVAADGTSNEIGIVSEDMIKPALHYIGDRPHAGDMPGAGFFPLMRVAQSIIRTTRECEVVEIGIRSRVYQQLNGLCNFQTLPTPTELHDADDDKIALQSGTTNAYIKRASAFVIMVRKAGKDSSGNLYEWKQLGASFVVIGSQPVDQYNWIRIKNPERGLYEYQIKPKSGANIHRNSDEKPFIYLQASATNEVLVQRDTDVADIGRFVLTTRGTVIKKKEFKTNKEFMNNPVIGSGTTTRSRPTGVSITEKLPSSTGNRVTRATSATFVRNDGTPGDSSRPGGRHGGFYHEIFGSAETSLVAAGATTKKWVREDIGGKELNIEYEVRRTYDPDHWSGQDYRWEDTQSYNVRPPGGEWNVGDEFCICRTLGGSNPFKSRSGYPDLTQGCVCIKIASVTEDEDSTLGKAHAMRWELFGNPESLNPGYEKTITVTDLSALKLEMKARVIEHQGDVWPGITRSWGPEHEINVVQDSGTGTAWNEGDTTTYEKTVSSGNPFRVPNTKVGYIFRINTVGEVEVSSHVEHADRIFEEQSQYADLSLYGDSLVNKSNLSQPEHTVSYLNEIVSNPQDQSPNYDKMTISGLSLKAGRNFSQIDQLRCWLKEGIHVRNLHPDDGNTIGPSNLYTDLVYYLLTDEVAGAGRILGISDTTSELLVDKEDLAETSKFLRKNKLFCNGTISKPRSIREFISSTAPSFLCDAVLKDGRFSVRPALPVRAGGEINGTNAVDIKQIFTTGNIIEDSFETIYLSGEERKPCKAVVRYRQEEEDTLAKEKTIELSLKRTSTSSNNLPVEPFDLTAFCTTEHHAKLFGKYVLSLRERITHTISFSTTPHGLDLAPGDFIKVVTETTPYSPAANGSINGSGVILSASDISDGNHSILYYVTGSEDEAKLGHMTVSGGIVSDATFYNSIFTIQNTTASQNVYRVESLTLGEDMVVQITASEFPCDNSFVSLIAKDVITDSEYTIHL